MSGFRLNKTSQYIIHRIACSRLSVSWDEWKEKGAREKRRGRTGKRRGSSPFSLFFSVCLFVCLALVFLFARSHLPRVWNSYQKHIRKDWRWTPPLISSLRLKKKIEKNNEYNQFKRNKFALFWEVTLVIGNKKESQNMWWHFQLYTSYLAISRFLLTPFYLIKSFHSFSQITRRYAEFSAAIVSLNESFPDEKVWGIVKP